MLQTIAGTPETSARQMIIEETCRGVFEISVHLPLLYLLPDLKKNVTDHYILFCLAKREKDAEKVSNIRQVFFLIRRDDIYVHICEHLWHQDCKKRRADPFQELIEDICQA